MTEEFVVESAPAASIETSQAPGLSDSGVPVHLVPEASMEELVPAVEALLLATGEPLSLSSLADLLDVDRSAAQKAIDLLCARFAGDEHGITLVELAGGFQFATKSRYAELIEKMLKEIKKVRLSPAALETLAIVAYRQPVTRAEIEAVRGGNVDGVMKTLLDRELLKISGKKDEPGKPLLYGTTENFLLQFGLRSIKDLPPLSEFDEIARARATGEIEEVGPNWEEISTSQRDALDALAAAAERELGDLDERIKSLKPPKVVTLDEK